MIFVGFFWKSTAANLATATYCYEECRKILPGLVNAENRSSLYYWSYCSTLLVHRHWKFFAAGTKTRDICERTTAYGLLVTTGTAILRLGSLV